ncbi:MAG TPA: class I SAM-dependent methyltransferase [Spirochaetota bacterium]|nr:class I SAM-dependent methyltransferase [Spirochaetota bacterium]
MRFNEKRFAEEYEERLTGEGYPGNLLQEVQDHIGPVDSIIDAGAGAGHFTIPLAAEGHHVTAIEPSREMTALLQGKINSSIASRITIVQSTWEEWDGEKADALICIHAIYGMKERAASLIKMHAKAHTSILIFRAESGSRSCSDLIRSELGISRGPLGMEPSIRDILTREGIPFTVTPLIQERIRTYTDPETEAEYYCYHLGLGNEKKDAVMDILLRHSTQEGGAYNFTGTYHDLLFCF